MNCALVPSPERHFPRLLCLWDECPDSGVGGREDTSDMISYNSSLMAVTEQGAEVGFAKYGYSGSS